MTPTNILFLCTGNACRSQMAEGWVKALLPEGIHAYSAGTQPHGVDPAAIKVMAEVGVDLSSHTSKHLDDLAHIDFDWVVTVCDRASEACPVFPGIAKRLHHSFDDPPQLAKSLPAEESLQPYRRVRDEICAFIETLPILLENRS